MLRLLGARSRLLVLAGMLELGLLGAVTAVLAAGLGTLGAWAAVGAVAPGAWTFQPAATALLAAAPSPGWRRPVSPCHAPPPRRARSAPSGARHERLQ